MKKTSFYLVLLLGIITLFGLDNASAATISSASGSAGDMGVVLCNVLKFVTGTVGKTIASFIIIGVGLGFFTAKVSWGVLIGVTLGIAAMFGAPAIVKAVTGDTTTICSTTP
ncbi:MAG: TrbC/VirB2 family protein [Rickettsiales bacterium]|nr:TrbC/VirB2 family protein [Rickettsiales bacterium]